MVSENMFEEKLGSLCSSDIFPARDGIAHLAEVVSDHHHVIILIFGSWERPAEIRGDKFPPLLRDCPNLGQAQRALVPCFVLLAEVTGGDVPADEIFHSLPIEISF